MIAAVAIVAVIGAVIFGIASKKSGPGGDVPPVNENKPSGPATASEVKNDQPSIRDEAFYQARWRMIQEESKLSGLELKQVEKFVADAGPKAPAEAVAALAELRAAESQSRALVLRNELLDLAAAFKPDQAKNLDFDAVDALLRAAQSKLAELKKLDAGQPEPVFLPEHRKTVDAYLKKLSDLQLAVSLGGDISSGTKPETAGTEQKPGASAQTSNTETEKTDPETEDAIESLLDSKLLMNYLLLLDYLPGTIRDEQKCAEALRLVNDLLADKEFTDENPRKNCSAIRKFLVLNNAPLLPYLDENQKALRGMKAFPRSYPDSVLDDISGSTFRLKVQDGKANIIQRVAWNQLRREEGEDRIIVTLINSPQLAKLSAEFREYLYVRALFLGVDPEMLKTRFERASGLPAAKLEELGKVTGFFRKPLIEDEEED